MDVIRLIEDAITAEQEAVKTYKQGAELAEDPEMRTFFEQLVSWEEEHERILKDRLATLKLIKGDQG